MTILMESCWSEDPQERPSFRYILEILEVLSPLKGSQTYKRALLLQRESESLEEYISHDTQQLFQENEKYTNLLARIIPTSIASTINEGKECAPKYYEHATLMLLKVSNIADIILASSPTEAIEVLHYVLKAITAIITHRKFNITEIFNEGDCYMIGILFIYFIFI